MDRFIPNFSISCLQKIEKIFETFEEKKPSVKIAIVIFLVIFIYLFYRFIIGSFATICMDGSFSFSSGSGTCSHHGGVKRWK